MTEAAPSFFASRHSLNGMVCSIDHLASAAGLSALRQGGSAADAAIATSAVLAVTCQHMCGVGGDLWALVHVPGKKRPFALNASGRSGSGARIESLLADGLSSMPFHGDPRSVPIPGCVDGWLALHKRFGRLNLETVLEDAILLASDGFPIGAECADATRALERVPNTDDYLHEGPPKAGSIIRRPGLAKILSELAAGSRSSFYEGTFGEELLAFGSGEYHLEDLKVPQAEWVRPIQTRAFEHQIWGLPPNSQGYLCLSSAWIASQLGIPTDSTDSLFWHLLAESARQAGFDRPIALHEFADGEQLVSHERLSSRALAISNNEVSSLGTGVNDGDTIYLNAVDKDRMGISLIQSNASGWGALAFLPETRISLHNRGIGFSVAPNSPAAYGPHKRPPHTLAPIVIQRDDGTLRALVGTIGGDSQPQIVLQLLTRLLHCGESSGEALAAPRWRFADRQSNGFNTWAKPDDVVLEVEGDDPELIKALHSIGHEVRHLPAGSSAFGHAHIIEVVGELLSGAAEPRVQTSGLAAY